MKKLITIAILAGFLFVPFALTAADKMETITFAWDDTNEAGKVKNFEMYWSETAGGPYTKMATIPYATPPHEAPIEATVSGSPGTTETRYFVLTSCGDVLQQDGSTEYMCAGDGAGNVAYSNEVSHNFWIQPTGFSVPIQFRKIVTP
jgi:hypothetical protein